MRFYSIILLATVYQSISVLAAPVSSEVNFVESSVNVRRRLHRRVNPVIHLKNCVNRVCQQAHRGLDNCCRRLNQAVARHAKSHPDFHPYAVGLGIGTAIKGIDMAGDVVSKVVGNVLSADIVNERIRRKDKKTKGAESVGEIIKEDNASTPPQTNEKTLHQTTIKAEPKTAPKTSSVPVAKADPIAAVPAPKTVPSKVPTPGETKN